ncbi:MAG: ion channel [bacterium]
MVHELITTQLIIGGILIAITTVIHAVFIAVSSELLRRFPNYGRGYSRIIQDVIRLVSLTLWLAISHFLSMWLWAGTFLLLKVFNSLEAALYFAAATYTTLGFGDVLATQEWRLLSGAASINGLLMLGLSVAILVDASARLRLGGD